MILGGRGDIFDLLTEIAAPNLRSACARRRDETNGEALIIGHGDQRGFSVARKSLDTDLMGIDGLVGLEVIERAARSPGPGSQSAPIIK